MNSRAKGQRFERAMCDALGEWWGCKFRRTPLSGGWAQSALVGDITPVTTPEHPWLFSVECKHTQTWSIDAFARNDRSELQGFFEQCIWDATTKKLIPLLICHKNHTETLVFIPSEVGVSGKMFIDVTVDHCPRQGHWEFSVVKLGDLTSEAPDCISSACKILQGELYGRVDSQGIVGG